MRARAVKYFAFAIAFFCSVAVNAQMGVSGPILGPMPAGTVSSAAFPLLAPNGTPGAPSYAFASSTNTGIFLTGGGFDISMAGVSKFHIDSGGYHMSSDRAIGWGSNTSASSASFDLTLFRDAAATLAQRDGTNAQTLRIYNTFTDASNYERLAFSWSGTSARIMHEAAGTGIQRPIILAGQTVTFAVGSSPTTTWSINNSGNITAANDNSWDIGASGASRPRSLYLGTSLNVAQITAGSGNRIAFSGFSTNPVQLAATQATAPTCTSNCGTSPTVAGSDSVFKVTMGASGVPASGFVITFNGTWAAAPVCTGAMMLAGMVIGKLPTTLATTTTTLTVVTNGTAPSNSDVYGFQCMAGS